MQKVSKHNYTNSIQHVTIPIHTPVQKVSKHN